MSSGPIGTLPIQAPGSVPSVAYLATITGQVDRTCFFVTAVKAHFEYVASDVQTPDGRTVIAPAGNAPGNWVLRAPPSEVDITTFGAIGNGVNDDTLSIQAAHDALNAAGGTITVPNGTYRVSALVFTKPVRLDIGRATFTGISQTDLITTNNNLIVGGVSGRETLFYPKDGYAGIRLNGSAWAQPQLGQPQFICERVGFSGGLHGVNADIPPPAGFEEGLFVIQDCVFLDTTGYAIYLGQSVFLSYITRCFANNVYGFAHIRDNTETKCYGNTVNIASNGQYSYKLDGSHHVILEADELYGGRMNINADVAIIPRNYDDTQAHPDTNAIPSSGIIDLISIKFAPELEYTLRFRPKVIVLPPDGTLYPNGNIDRVQDFGAYNINIERCKFDSTTCFINHAVRDGYTGDTWVTIELGSDIVTGERMTDHGLQVGQVLHILGMSGDGYVLNGEHICTQRTPTSIKFAHNPGSLSGNYGGYCWNGSSSAIVMLSPAGRMRLSGNDFYYFAHGIDDTGYYNQGPYGLSGQCDWDGSNRMVGPGCRNVTPFARAGSQFERVAPPAHSYVVPVDPDAPTNVTQAILRNDIKCSSNLTNATYWTAHGVTATAATDRFGGTKAHKLVRNGNNNAIGGSFSSLTNTYHWQINECLETKIDVSNPNFTGAGRLSLFAKGDSSVGTRTGSLFVAILDKTAEKLFLCQHVSIPYGTWSQKRINIDFVYPNGWDTNNTYLLLCPGTWDDQPAVCWIDDLQLCDGRGSDYIATSGTAYYDTSIGSLVENGFAVSDLRTFIHRGVSPTAVNLTGAGTGATASLVAGSNDLEGIIEINTGTTPSATGTVGLAFSRTIAGTFCISWTLEDFNRTWNTGATVKTTSQGSTGINCGWSNNGSTLNGTPSNAAYRISYKCGRIN